MNELLFYRVQCLSTLACGQGFELSSDRFSKLNYIPIHEFRWGFAEFSRVRCRAASRCRAFLGDRSRCAASSNCAEIEILYN